jgi:hypothetical protein
MAYSNMGAAGTSIVVRLDSDVSEGGVLRGGDLVADRDGNGREEQWWQANERARGVYRRREGHGQP